jgi:tryptophan-rich sensory protein
MRALIVFLALSFAVAFFGARFQPGSWYAELVKPAWTPPNWIFPPVWTVLYAAIALAAWLVWRRSRRIDAALGLWGVQLALNAAWSWLFFGLHRPDLALVDIALLWIAAAAFAVAAWRSSPLAAALFVPYLMWLGFAAALNFSIWQLNPLGSAAGG